MSKVNDDDDNGGSGGDGGDDNDDDDDDDDAYYIDSKGIRKKISTYSMSPKSPKNVGTLGGVVVDDDNSD